MAKGFLELAKYWDARAMKVRDTNGEAYSLYLRMAFMCRRLCQ